MLTDNHKRNRIEVSRKVFNRYADGEALLDFVVTGDETWFKRFTQESK